jgi:hypothetical protein
VGVPRTWTYTDHSWDDLGQTVFQALFEVQSVGVGSDGAGTEIDLSAHGTWEFTDAPWPGEDHVGLAIETRVDGELTLAHYHWSSRKKDSEVSARQALSAGSVGGRWCLPLLQVTPALGDWADRVLPAIRQLTEMIDGALSIATDTLVVDDPALPGYDSAWLTTWLTNGAGGSDPRYVWVTYLMVQKDPGLPPPYESTADVWVRSGLTELVSLDLKRIADVITRYSRRDWPLSSLSSISASSLRTMGKAGR